MALTPIDEAHALQIQAGTLGRKAGHAFEDSICSEINGFEYPMGIQNQDGRHLFKGDPARLILGYLMRFYDEDLILSAVALSTGALATSEGGKKWLQVNGSDIRRCKSDIIITMSFQTGKVVTSGISTKQCNNPNPTNAQLYFTTARGFVKLLGDNGISISPAATNSLRQFCGDVGFRPIDLMENVADRAVDPRRYFWEEMRPEDRAEWEAVLSHHQDDITRLLLQKAYFDDPFVPDFLMHKTKMSQLWDQTEVAIYSIDQLVNLSHNYQGFTTKAYSVRKGSYCDPDGVTHLAPRFGVVQMQRGGQAQHPDQLQFNLEASYFYRLEKIAM